MATKGLEWHCRQACSWCQDGFPITHHDHSIYFHDARVLLHASPEADPFFECDASPIRAAVAEAVEAEQEWKLDADTLFVAHTALASRLEVLRNCKETAVSERLWECSYREALAAYEKIGNIAAIRARAAASASTEEDKNDA